MIGILHGYLLEGSGSNIWTRSIVRSLCKNGETVHLVCQENHPENYDFISEYRCYSNDSVEIKLNREVPYKGKCIMHKPQLGDTLPVYVWDKYEEFSNVVPMTELSNTAIEDYVEQNTKVVLKIINDYELTALHVNHAVLMSVVAQRVNKITSIPFAIMPHGSAIEYAVKKDKRFLDLATKAFESTKKIFVVSTEMENRISSIFQSIPNINQKMTYLNLGVDTSIFKPISPELRHQNIEKLFQKLKDLPRGKNNEQSNSLRRNLSSTLQLKELSKIISSTTDYQMKYPDVDVEAKLEKIDWTHDKVILFVGRLITSKGIQSVIATLPLIFHLHPNARLIVVGHGPSREIMEIFLWALENNERELVQKIIIWGKSLEGNLDDKSSFEDVVSFFNQLEKNNELDSYYEKAHKHLRSDKVIFTGYLGHEELGYLYPCCDVAIFPSVVMEAGPLVFLEALASGCFPLGTYFGGMAVNIDSISDKLPKEISDLMKISIENDRKQFDIVKKINYSLLLDGKYRFVLSKTAKELYDWSSVGEKISSELNSMNR
ncbi:MAG: glycosyltransferase [Nitrosopumilus sp.]|nr:glycosyltransferase [Nitrosopumilus sp.]MDH3856120.1 glycosyltransferase [Nitrosopumilus sp.]